MTHTPPHTFCRVGFLCLLLVVEDWKKRVTVGDTAYCMPYCLPVPVPLFMPNMAIMAH